MKELSPEEITLLATMIATEIAKDKSIDEISCIKNILSQVLHSLSTIVGQRIINKLDKK